MTSSSPLPVALSIAGSDPSGGAGIQADLKVFHAHRVYGTAVVAVLTVQNTLGVLQSRAVEPDLVAAQLTAVLDDLPVAAAKTGALGEVGTVTAVAEAWRHRSAPLVVDPVLVSTSGRRLLDADAIQALRSDLMPLATLITPNIAEAEVLGGHPIRDIGDMEEAGRRLRADGAQAVLLKGGHLDGEPVDVLVTAEGSRRYHGSRLQTEHDHGTGCVLSAAIAAQLAKGHGLGPSVESARAVVAAALRGAPGLGSGRGPLDLWASADDAGLEQAE